MPHGGQRSHWSQWIALAYGHSRITLGAVAGTSLAVDVTAARDAYHKYKCESPQAAPRGLLDGASPES
jgi:hypothetical protein